MGKYQYHKPTNDKEENKVDVLSSPSFCHQYQNLCPWQKLTGADQLFLFLSWLGLGSPMSRYIITLEIFYLNLSYVSVCPTLAVLIKTMPQCLKKIMQRSLFFYYKHYITYKGILGNFLSWA